MKRILSFAVTMALCAVMLMIPFTVSAKAAPVNNSNEELVNSYVEHYADGSYAEIKVMKNTSTKGFMALASSSSWTQSGSKQYTWYKSDGSAAMSFTLYGTFDVYGDGATCVDTSYGSESYDSACSVESQNTYASGNQAVGTATLVRKLFFVPIAKKNIQLVLTCDGNGNLS